MQKIVLDNAQSAKGQKTMTNIKVVENTKERQVNMNKEEKLSNITSTLTPLLKEERVKKAAFTLAETLITLTILGIIASITIPNLINSYNERQYVTKLKKEYATLSNALEAAVVENGPVTSWNFKNSNDYGNKEADIVLQKLIPYLNVSQNCGWEDTSCAPSNIKYSALNKNIEWPEPPSNKRFARAILKDGALIFINTFGSTTATANEGKDYAYIKVDVNGKKGPNRLGVDTFDLVISETGLVPGGIGDEEMSGCDINSSNPYNGISCALHVIRNGNMDYLRRR